MASSMGSAGPYGGQADGFCELAGGVLRSGHVITNSTAYYARDRLVDPAGSKEDRRRALLCLQTVVAAQISRHVIARTLNVAGLDGRGTWYLAVGDTTGGGPHFNLEDFIGSAILQIFHNDAVKDHADWPNGLVDRLRQCLAEAVRCGIRRSVRISYTNPVAMGIECSALAGELLGIAEFVEYARRRLEQWIAFTEKAGTFEEFNSPCYGGVTLPHTATLVERVKDADIRRQALRMERKYFDHVCAFYHAPTRELSLPQARAYSDRFAGSQLHNYLSCALGKRRPGAFDPPPPGWASAALNYCHATERQIDRLLSAIGRPRETRVFCERIGCAHVGPLNQVPPPAKGTPTRRRELVAWRDRRFCIGSVNEIDSWQQRRAVGGYILCPGGSVLFAWKPRIAVAGADEDEQERRWPTLMYFNLCTGQDRSTVLAGLSAMPIDEGWLCGSHWRQQVGGRVRGISVDLGFDILLPRALPSDGPLASAMQVPIVTSATWRLDVGQTTVSLLFLGGHVGATQADPKIVKTDAGWRISLLRLEDFQLDWSSPPEVGMAFVLDFSPKGEAPDIRDASWQVRGTVLTCQAAVGRRRLSLRHDPPRIENLTRQACFLTVQAAD